MTGRILDKTVVRERLLDAFDKLDKIYDFDISVELLDVTSMDNCGNRNLTESGLVEIRVRGVEKHD